MNNAAKTKEISEAIKVAESNVHNAETGAELEASKKELKALWRNLARTGAGYSRKNAQRIG